MNLSEITLKVATLAALTDWAQKQYAEARAEAAEVYKANGIKKLAIQLPDGDVIGDITVKQPSPTVKLDDEALIAWVAEHTPTEIEEYLDSSVLLDQEAIEWAREHRDDLLRRRVRAVWLKEKRAEAVANDGHVIDADSGEATKIAEVTANRPTGEFALSADPRGERARRLIEALRAGELTGIPTLPQPAITAGEVPGNGSAPQDAA